MNSALAVALRWMRPLAFREATVDFPDLDEETVHLVFFVPRTFEEGDLLDDLLEEPRDPPFCAETTNGRSSARTSPIRAKRFIIELFFLKRWMALSVSLLEQARNVHL